MNGLKIKFLLTGKKKMLRKCENKHIPNFIVGIKTSGARILVSDNQESVHFVRYKAQVILWRVSTLQGIISHPFSRGLELKVQAFIS